MAIPNLNPDWIEQRKGQIPQARIGWIKRSFLDIPYGDEPLQQLDIYLPDEEKESYPFIINVHGGGFVHCDKRDFHLYPTFYALQRGYAVAAVNYRLSPAVRYPAHIEDVALALEFLSREGGNYRLDTQRAFLWGTSAGGNIVLQLSKTDGLHKRNDSLRLLGTAAFCPLISLDDLELRGGLMMKLRGSLLLRVMLKGMFGTANITPGQKELVDVKQGMEKGLAPIYLQQGTLDPALPYAAAKALAQRMACILPPDELVFDTLEGARHAGDGDAFFLPGNIHPVLDFFDRQLQKAGGAGKEEAGNEN